MMKNFVFTLAGVLVGLAIFGYGFYSNKSKNYLAVRTAQKTNVEELQKNIILDPVDIKKPEAEVAEKIPTPQVVPAATLATTPTPVSATPTLASEITPVPAKEPEPQVYDGWANAGYLPEDAPGADVEVRNLPDDEPVTQ